MHAIVYSESNSKFTIIIWYIPTPYVPTSLTTIPLIMPTAGDELPTFLRNVFLIILTLIKNSSRIKLRKQIILDKGLFFFLEDIKTGRPVSKCHIYAPIA